MLKIVPQNKNAAMVNVNDCCVICGKYLPEGEGMVCKKCLEEDMYYRPLRNLHINNSYNVWLTSTMLNKINETCDRTYGTRFADKVLNRTYRGMYIEWYLHNIGYFITIPFIKNRAIKSLNERFKHVDLEEHR